MAGLIDGGEKSFSECWELSRRAEVQGQTQKLEATVVSSHELGRVGIFTRLDGRTDKLKTFSGTKGNSDLWPRGT